MMNVLLVITNVNGFHEVPYSFGLSSIAAYAISKGHAVRILDIRSEKDFLKLSEEIRNFKPKVVGFSSVSSQFFCVKKSAEIIKNIDNSVIIVVGGVHPTIYPAALKESPHIDAFFVGESEISFGEFLEKVQTGQKYQDIDNLAYIKDGNLVINPLKPLISSLDILPHPVKDALFDEYIRKEGVAPFFFSRGCPFLCTFCSNHALAKIYGMKTNKPRFKSVDGCIDEIKEAEKTHAFNVVHIDDDTFGLDRVWRDDFCQKYKEKVNKKFICLLRVNVVDEEFIKKLKEAGCIRIQFGVESGNDYVRNTIMNRNITDAQIINAFAWCKKYNIETTALNIIGVPGETEEMIMDTVRLNRKIKPTYSGVNIFYPYKGTVLGNYCFDNNLVDEELYDNFSKERRDTVLKYPPEYKAKLRYYHKNWQVLVYPYDIRKRMMTTLLNCEPLYMFLRGIKQAVSPKNMKGAKI